MSDDVLIGLTINYNSDWTVEELWPDGDAPERITAEEVAAVIDKHGLTDGLNADVWVEIRVQCPNPAWQEGMDPLPGIEAPSQFLTTEAGVQL